MNENSPTIRVLHVVGWLGSGGIEKLLISFIENMNREAVTFDFLLLTHDKGFYDEYVQELGSKLLYLDLKQHKGIFMQRIAKLSDFYRFMKTKTGEYSIVHLHGHEPSTYVYAFLAKKAGVKCVIIHAHNTKSLTGTRTRILPLFKFLFGRYPSYYLACSQEAADYMWPKDVDADKCSVVINGIDFSKYEFSQEKRKKFREENHLEGKYVVGHIGRFADQKNHRFLFKVFKGVLDQIPNSILLLVGEGPKEKEVRQMAVTAGVEDKTVFFGTTKDVPSALMGMDVMCFPSHYEGLGIVVIEAQAASLPVVVSEGVPESANISSYYHKLNLNDALSLWVDTVSSLGGYRGIQKVIAGSEFDIKSTVAKLTKIYEDLVNR